MAFYGYLFELRIAGLGIVIMYANVYDDDKEKRQRMDNLNVFTMQLFLLGLMLVGFITAKFHIIDEHFRSKMTDLVLGVFLPCNILSSFFGADRSRLASMGVIVIVSVGTLAFTYGLSRVLFLKTGKPQKSVLVYGTLISNAGFLGNPVIQSIFGIDALTYAAAYLIPVRIAVWTFGITVFTGGKGNLKKILFHPCLLATYIGIAVMITGFVPPSPVSRFVFTLGDCTTPLSMMVVGGVLGLVEPKKIISRLSLYYTFIRLVFIPLLVMGVLLLFRTNPLISGISVVMAGTPAGVTTSILAEKYGADTELASSMVFLSTVLSIITIPALVWLLEAVL